MQKKLIALAVAGLSTAAFAQTNVTIYGVADVSAQGTNMSSSNALPYTTDNTAGKVASGGSFNMTNNSSLLGFKGTEDLGNGLKGLFQVETNVNLTGGSAVAVGNGSTWGSMRDSYVGLNSKYGTVMGGYLSTPYRSALNSFDVMPGATGSGRIENIMGKQRFNSTNIGLTGANAVNTQGVQADSSVRATALAYAMPTMYGINGSIAYTGSANNGQNNDTTTTLASSGATTIAPQSAMSLNLGWEGYGVGIKGAFQQAKVNNNTINSANAYTSYLIGAQYTGVPGLKAAVVYNRNTMGLNQNGDNGAMKGSNNQIWAGVSYRFGNNEPRLSYVNSSNTSGLSGADIGQDGGAQWTANWGYYLSKRTQVYGLVSQVKNNANGIWNPAGGNTNLLPTGGQNILTYGAGMRTNF